MTVFTSKDVKDYYDQTESHFRRFWKMDKVMGLHYGIWDKNTSSITDAILNTNRIMMGKANITDKDKVLDAGCGVGGSAIFLAKNRGCRVHGISLSEKQVTRAKSYANNHQVDQLVQFSVRNYLATKFTDQSFDVIWALESFSSCTDNAAYFQEMFRILAPGGRLVILDFFKPNPMNIEKDKDLKMMMNGWAITDIMTIEEIQQLPQKYGFSHIEIHDYSPAIQKSVRYMYWAGWMGMLGTKAYNLFRKASPFSRIHYKTGIAQKKAYDRGSWGYYLVSMVKNH